MTTRYVYHPVFRRSQAYRLSVIASYLLVPLSYVTMYRSFQVHTPRDALFPKFFAISVLAALVAIPIWSLWLKRCAEEGLVSRERLDLVFSAAPIGIPVFYFMLAWLNVRQS